MKKNPHPKMPKNTFDKSTYTRLERWDMAKRVIEHEHHLTDNWPSLSDWWYSEVSPTGGTVC